MKALSIRQPWAWAICYAGKDIENRDWPTKFRGEFLIHASKGMTRAEYADFNVAMSVIGQRLDVPPADELLRGGIVGKATLVNCVTNDPSPWFFGKYGFVLSDVEPLPFVPWPGSRKWFDVPPDITHA